VRKAIEFFEVVIVLFFICAGMYLGVIWANAEPVDHTWEVAGVR
jgi:hypothetical protein